MSASVAETCKISLPAGESSGTLSLYTDWKAGTGGGKRKRGRIQSENQENSQDSKLKLRAEPEQRGLYLFAYWAVVIGIQHLDLYNSFGSEDAITGSNVKEVIVLFFTVQGLPDRDLPFILNMFNGKLA